MTPEAACCHVQLPVCLARHSRTFNAEHLAGMHEASVSFSGIEGGPSDENYVDLRLTTASEKV
jgi:hypothetical protein